MAAPSFRRLHQHFRRDQRLRELAAKNGVLERRRDALEVELRERTAALCRCEDRLAVSETSAAHLEAEMYAAREEIERIHSSLTYRIGRALTWPARKVRTFARCISEHGLAYTLRVYVGRGAE